MKKIISLLLVFAMLFAVAACTPASTTGGAGNTTGSTTPKPENNGFDEKNIVLTFGAISDIHLETSGHDSKFEKALSTLSEYTQDKGNPLNAIVIVGDICQNKNKISLFKDIFEGSGINTELFFTLGNHDQETKYDNVALTLSDFKAVLGDSYFSANDNLTTGDRYMAVEDAEGKMHHFLIVQPNSYGNSTDGDKVTFNASSITWLDAKLAEITTADPNAYVYVFTHAMIAETCYGSDLDVDGIYKNKGKGSYWYTSELNATLDKYPQVITFSGHLHFPINDERSIMQDKFTAIGTGSVANLAIEDGYANASGTRPSNYTSISSGHIVEVDINGNVRIVRLNLATGEQFGAPWVLDAPKADKSHLTKYSAKRAEANKAPSMEGIVPEVSVNLIGGNRIASLSFASGTDDNFIHHYEIKVTNTKTGSVIKDIKYLTDFYLYTDLAQMAKANSLVIGAVSGGDEYKVEVTAVDSWGAKSATVSGTFTVSNEFDSKLPEPLCDIEFNKDGTATDKKGVATVTLVGGATISEKNVKFNGVTKPMVGLHSTKSGQSGTFTFENYTIADMDALYNGASGFSFEVFYVNRTKSGTQGIFCATEYGGLGFAEKSAGMPGFCVYGSSKKTFYYTADSKVSSATDLTHVVTTAIYYGGSVYTGIYVNGELKDSQTVPGKVWMTDSKYKAYANQLSICNDIGPSGFPTTDCTVVDVKVYNQCLNPAQVKTAYENAKALFAN